MYNANFPHKSELPSTAKLVKSTIIAAVSALVILVTVVMPAEYGIDPVGIGRLLGLKKMGEIKMSLAREAAAAEQGAQTASAGQPVPEMRMAVAATPEKPGAAAGKVRSDELRVTLAPDQGVEVKVALAKGRQVKYNWASSGGKANYDVHGDSKELRIRYHGYGKGSEQKKEGVLKAAFDGQHGWFWRNRTGATITVTLKVSGEHTGIKQAN